jgi:hypothetical protein
MWVGRGDAETEIRISYNREKKRLAGEPGDDPHAEDEHAHPLTPGATHAPDAEPNAIKPTSHRPYQMTTDAQAQAVASDFIADAERADKAIEDAARGAS